MPSNSILPLFIISITYSGTAWCLLDGNATIGDSFKYQIYLRNTVYMSCSGAIIHERHILTAAHCVFRNMPNQLTVLVSTSLAPGLLNPHEVQQIHVHKNYDVDYYSIVDMTSNPWPYHRANDIAVLTLKIPLQPGGNFKIVRLPTQTIMPCTSADCVMTGWGVSHEDRRNDYVHLLWAKSELLVALYCHLLEVPTRTNELCVADVRDAVRVNHLDTGGGLVCDGILVGIITTHNRPVAAADVHHFLPFINEILSLSM